MPSGRTHDWVTFLLAVPTAMAGYAFTQNFASAAVVGAAFLFGGLMFGPDLDTVSRPLSRWSVFRILWLPYRSFFRHRSRFTHGLVFGSLLRVVYFLGILTVAAFAAAYIFAAWSSGKPPDPLEFARAWGPAGDFVRRWFGPWFLALLFLGIWLGAATHTLTDLAGSYIKTGRIRNFF